MDRLPITPCLRAILRRLAQGYGRVGGLDRMATVINAIRADRPDAILLDGGDTWHGSYTCLITPKARTWSM